MEEDAVLEASITFTLRLCISFVSMAVALHPNGAPAKSLGHWSPRRRCRKLLKGLRPVCVQSQQRSGVAAARTACRPVQSRRDTRKPSALHLVTTVSPSVDFFEAAINSLVGGSAVICFALAFVPLLTYEEGKSVDLMALTISRPDGRGVREEDDLETIKWSVASIVSFFPYLNWTVSDDAVCCSNCQLVG